MNKGRNADMEWPKERISLSNSDSTVDETRGNADE